eukprot:scaffold2261_cov405-Prasinococcus_capsulatus_cf.AAC.43
MAVVDADKCPHSRPIVTENGTVHNEFHVSSGNSGGQIPEESWDNLKEVGSSGTVETSVHADKECWWLMAMSQMISESVTVGVGQANRTQHSEKKWKKDFGELPKLISCTVGRRKSKAMYFVENSSDVAGLMHAFAEVVTRENGGHPHVCADAAMCPNPRGG